MPFKGLLISIQVSIYWYHPSEYTDNIFSASSFYCHDVDWLSDSLLYTILPEFDLPHQRAINRAKDNDLSGTSGFNGMEWWTGMVEWNSEMEWRS